METYIIDEGVARMDMDKMRQSIDLLTKARQSLMQLLENAGNIQGQTGRAIEEKAQELQGRIDFLIAQLQGSIEVTDAAVRRYQQIDSNFAAIIRR